MFSKTAVILLIATFTNAADISSSYSLLEKHAAFNPDLKTEPIANHSVLKKDAKPEELHPVFKEAHHQGRATIELVKSEGPVVKHDMLADQPNHPQQEVNRIDNLAIPNYAYLPAPAEVAYPDVPYAPGYAYDNGYSASNGYDSYGNSLSSYMLEPDTSSLSLLWSQVPDSRAIVGFVGRTIAWMFNSMFVILLGSFLTIAVCSYSELCSIHFHGVGPIHEEMRSLMTPERLEKISHAADFVKNAIDKYQTIQKATKETRNRRSILY